MQPGPHPPNSLTATDSHAQSIACHSEHGKSTMRTQSGHLSGHPGAIRATHAIRAIRARIMPGRWKANETGAYVRCAGNPGKHPGLLKVDLAP